MRRSTRFVASLSPLKATITSALVLATMVACSDSTSPVKAPQDGVRYIHVVVPDSLKQALSAQDAASSVEAPTNLLAFHSGLSSSVLASPAQSASLAACGGGGSGFAGYTKSRVAFDSVEAAPNHVMTRDSILDDGIAVVPIGFKFSFYGNTYDSLNVYSNGFITFGTALIDPTRAGFYRGGPIENPLPPNNLIAFAWMDWSPQAVPDGIRFETRGTAPHRRFLLQFTDVPEYHSTGRLTAQVVLTEGSNDITIYTTKFSMSSSANKWTQGIENATGTNALYDSIQVASTGAMVKRVQAFFAGISLTNDAIRFSLVSVKDVEKPSFTAAPESITRDNDPGLGSAVVAVSPPITTDNCGEATVSGVRSDGAAMDAPYPVGVTTITWTATDAAGNSASATQTVTVLDKEAPVFVAAPIAPPIAARTFGPSTTSTLTVNATSPSGAIVTYGVSVTDNVKVTVLSCDPASGSMFPADTVVHCTASDAAGNTSTASFSVIIVDAKEQIAALTEMIREELTLSNGTANPLINQLNSAASDQGNACQKMTVFLNLLSKKSISPQDVETMTLAAADIMGALGCNPATIPGTSATSSRVIASMK
jgi:hypothetical protein